MPVNDTHPQYAHAHRGWTKCRDVIAGEDVVKARGEAYLPKLSGSEEDEYNGYKMRAMFYGAADRTVRGLAGAVMRKTPDMTLPGAVEDLEGHIGVEGESLIQMCKCVVEEVIGIGRIGLLVDAPSQEHSDPYIASYYAENIINWRSERTNTGSRLTMIVLLETVEVPDATDKFKHVMVSQARELYLAVNDQGQTVYTVQLWRAQEQDKTFVWEKFGDATTPTKRGGGTWSEIPFVFVNPTTTCPDVEKSPMSDLVNVNLSHYRTSADLEHGRHFTALPTAWVAGFDTKTTRLMIGSSVAWVSSDPSAHAGFLEFSGAGLGSLSEAMKEKEKLMAILGARLLEEQKAMAEAATTVKLRQSGEQSILAHIAQAASEGLTRALTFVAQWLAVADAESTSIQLNQDFNLVGIDSQMLIALMNALQSGFISWETWFYNLQRGEIYPDSATSEGEKTLIEAGIPSSPVLGSPSNPALGAPGGATDKPLLKVRGDMIPANAGDTQSLA